jgi:hypothetical protein
VGARPPQGGFSVFGGTAASKTYVYVDGFNLFYGALRRTPYRWLDLAKLCRRYLPNDDVRTIKYFTAIVSARPSDPDQPVRQQLYLRALQTLPEVEIYYGQPVQMTLAPAP